MKKINMLIYLTAFTAVIFLSGCGKDLKPDIRGGELDLRGIDLSGRIIRLDGDWDFYWKRFIPSGEFESAPDKISVKVPSIWNDTTVNGSPLPGEGFATYRTRLKVKYSEKTFGIKMIDAATAYRLFVNGRMIAENGVVSEKPASGFPLHRPLTVPFKLDKPETGDDADVEIVIHVSNFHHVKGGLWESVRFGYYDEISRLRDKNIGIEMFLFGFILIMVIYHIGLYAQRREDKSALYFGILALFLALRIPVIGERCVTLFIPDFNWNLMIRLEYIFGFCNITFIGLFEYSLYGNKLPKTGKYIITGIGAALMASFTLLPVSIFLKGKIIYDLYLMLSGFYITVTMFYLAVRGNKGASIAFAGMAALYFTGINDILYTRLIVNTMNMASIGLVAFILAQTYLLSSLFSGAFKQSQIESEKNLRQGEEIKAQNDFIKNVLKTASAGIFEASKKMSGTLSLFRSDASEESASLEEVAASVEEISAAAQNISSGTDNQDTDLNALDSALKSLDEILKQTAKAVSDALSVAVTISDDARTGGESISVMKVTMDELFLSSKQMNSIIQIINDISDKINLLSLNAAIEAARAGDYGRGFAVVADEISKLADQTAASIKEIDSLIKKNESAIQSGGSNIQNAVTSVSKIISNVGVISTAISSISDFMKQQVELNSTINTGATRVKERGGEMKIAMKDEKNAVEEISNTITSISAISQVNSQRIEDMADYANSLTAMINEMNTSIEKYS